MRSTVQSKREDRKGGEETNVSRLEQVEQSVIREDSQGERDSFNSFCPRLNCLQPELGKHIG